LIEEPFSKEIFDFIKANAFTDPYALSLQMKHFRPDLRKRIAKQIHSRQKLLQKVPEWLEYEGLILPGPVSIEQASSSKTALYKSELLQRGVLMDLTGGLGVDTYYFSGRMEKVFYIEKERDIADTAAHNFALMGLNNVEVHCGVAEETLKNWTTPLDIIYADPSRRTRTGKIFKLEESEPNLIGIQDDLLQKARRVIIKASPFLDIQHGMKQVRNIREIHVIAVDHECKEILLVLDRQSREADPSIITVHLSGDALQRYVSSFKKENTSACKKAVSGPFIYDPNPAIRKAGLFRSVCHDFQIGKPADNSHIYFGDTFLDNFPGRTFKLIDIMPYNKFMKKCPYPQANIAARNFPLSVDGIRKKTGIREGGDIFVFGTTDQNKQNFFIICHKVR
jgi:16S rRNA G966 N2-methylase RsmD